MRLRTDAMYSGVGLTACVCSARVLIGGRGQAPRGFLDAPGDVQHAFVRGDQSQHALDGDLRVGHVLPCAMSSRIPGSARET